MIFWLISSEDWSHPTDKMGMKTPLFRCLLKLIELTLVTRTCNLGTLNDRAPVRQQPWVYVDIQTCFVYYRTDLRSRHDFHSHQQCVCTIYVCALWMLKRPICIHTCICTGQTFFFPVRLGLTFRAPLLFKESAQQHISTISWATL